MVLISLIAAVGLAIVHMVAGRLRLVHRVPRSRWLSFAGGASVGYVFLHLLPELSAEQPTIAEALPEFLTFFEHHIYLIALAGLVIFYGLERLAFVSRRQKGDAEAHRTNSGVFWLHIAVFTVYNTMIGHLLLHRENATRQALVFYALAMGFHFLVNDTSLEEHHEEDYRRSGRWILAGAILGGWLLGYLVALPEVVLSFFVAFLSGGVILNVLKEELPAERASRFGAFLLGVVSYGSLLLLA